MKEHAETAVEKRPALLPMLLVALSVAAYMAWQVVLVTRQYGNLEKWEQNQAEMTSRAAEYEARLQSIMMDVLDVAKTNPEAQSIVKKFNIKMNPTQRVNTPDAFSQPAFPPAGTP